MTVMLVGKEQADFSGVASLAMSSMQDLQCMVTQCATGADIPGERDNSKDGSE